MYIVEIEAEHDMFGVLVSASCYTFPYKQKETFKVFGVFEWVF